MTIKIDGLPPGVECYRMGVALENEFEIRSTSHGFEITQGPRADSLSQVIVRAKPGYDFRPYFKIRQYERGWHVVKLLEKPVVVTVSFRADNDFDLKELHETVEQIKTMSLFQAVIESEKL